MSDSSPGRSCTSTVDEKGHKFTLKQLNFDNLALRTLPVDSVCENYTRTVSGACFSLIEPTPVSNPVTVAVSKPALKLIGLLDDSDDVTSALDEEFAQIFSGNKKMSGSKTAAHCYCGHQFGTFAGQLGDGAAIYLGEVVERDGYQRWELQLKGAGKTPYSRTADGRKVLRSSIREFLCSEAMHHLGIPTTRAGCLVTSDTMVTRDVYYTGQPIEERASIVLRIAPTFIRFGSFEIFKTVDSLTGRRGPSVGRIDILHTLINYVISTFYPEIDREYSEQVDKYTQFYKQVVLSTAKLVAQWQCVGFCHGVLNTDNMSILGLTMDYGPFGFMDHFDPYFVCNGSDNTGRYAYNKQPSVCKWNLVKLAECIDPIVSKTVLLALLENLYQSKYEQVYLNTMRLKLGLITEQQSDSDLVQSLLNTMYSTGCDYTNTMRSLSRLPLPESENYHSERRHLETYLSTQCCNLETMLKVNKPSLSQTELQTLITILQTNPELAAILGGGDQRIKRELDLFERFHELTAMSNIDGGKIGSDRLMWSKWLDVYTERLKTETNTDTENTTSTIQLRNTERVALMNNNNPRFILRNYIAEQAITLAEKGDYSEVNRVLLLLQQPYSDINISQSATTATSTNQSAATASVHPLVGTYDSKPPDWSLDLCVT